MSKLFYDYLLEMDGVDGLIKGKSNSPEEKEELWRIVDEIVHHRIMGCVFDNLPKQDHQEFLEKFTARPDDENLIVYINGKSSKKIEDEIAKEVKNIESEILKEFKKTKKK